MIALVALAGAQVPDPGLPTEKRHMAILGTWSGLNLVGGTVGWALSDEPRARAFHATNAAWNTVNAGIVAASVAGLPRRREAASVEALRKRHRALRTTLGVNLGLDVAYTVTGAALWATGGEVRGVDLTGVGQSLVLQGGFLLAFDTAFLTSHHLRAGDVSASIGMTPGGIGVRGRW